MRTLDIGNNHFGPLLPESIGKCKRLHVLRVNDNDLVGFVNVSQIQKLTLLEEISFKNNEYLDDMCLENIREWARERGVSLERRDNFKHLDIKAADPVTESSDDEEYICNTSNEKGINDDDERKIDEEIETESSDDSKDSSSGDTGSTSGDENGSLSSDEESGSVEDESSERDDESTTKS